AELGLRSVKFVSSSVTNEEFRKPKLPIGLRLRYKVLYGVTKETTFKPTSAATHSRCACRYQVVTGAGPLPFSHPRLCRARLARAAQAARIPSAHGRRRTSIGQADLMRSLGTGRCIRSGACR